MICPLIDICLSDWTAHRGPAFTSVVTGDPTRHTVCCFKSRAQYWAKSLYRVATEAALHGRTNKGLAYGDGRNNRRIITHIFNPQMGLPYAYYGVSTAWK